MNPRRSPWGDRLRSASALLAVLVALRGAMLLAGFNQVDVPILDDVVFFIFDLLRSLGSWGSRLFPW